MIFQPCPKISQLEILWDENTFKDFFSEKYFDIMREREKEIRA
jgi:hypothetical protein